MHINISKRSKKGKLKIILNNKRKSDEKKERKQNTQAWYRIFHSSLDLVMLMSYDYHEVNRTSINAPLNREYNQNPYTETVAENVDRVLAQGCQADKIVMGIPTYGRTYTLKDQYSFGVDAPVDGPGAPGPFTLSSGSLGFNEVSFLREKKEKKKLRIAKFPFFTFFPLSQICSILSSGDWTIKHLLNNASKVARRGKEWIAYDDPETVYQKVCFLVNAFLFLNERCLWTWN